MRCSVETGDRTTCSERLPSPVNMMSETSSHFSLVRLPASSSSCSFALWR